MSALAGPARRRAARVCRARRGFRATPSLDLHLPDHGVDLRCPDVRIAWRRLELVVVLEGVLAGIVAAGITLDDRSAQLDYPRHNMPFGGDGLRSTGGGASGVISRLRPAGKGKNVTVEFKKQMVRQVQCAETRETRHAIQVRSDGSLIYAVTCVRNETVIVNTADEPHAVNPALPRGGPAGDVHRDRRGRRDRRVGQAWHRDPGDGTRRRAQVAAALVPGDPRRSVQVIGATRAAPRAHDESAMATTPPLRALLEHTLEHVATRSCSTRCSCGSARTPRPTR